MNYSAIPEELKNAPRWVNWRAEKRNGKITKPPVFPDTGNYMDAVSNPDNWQTFDQALKNTGKDYISGIGLVVAEDAFPSLVGIDIDHCIDKETGEIDPEAQALVDQLNSYTEVSPSGEGLRMFVYGVKPGDDCKSGNYEMYSKDRYFTVTGNHWPGTPSTVETNQEALETLYREKIQKPKGNGKAPAPEMHRGDDRQLGFRGTDEELLERARRAATTEEAIKGLRPKFLRLYDNGDDCGYASASDAEEACACMLAFWCGPDPERIERLFTASSGLQYLRSCSSKPDKWERADYVPRTVAKAIEFQRTHGGFYDQNYRDPSRDHLPKIEIVAGQGLRMVDEAEKALAADKHIYARDGLAVQMNYSPPSTAYKMATNPDARTLHFSPVTPQGLWLPLSRAANWKKYTEKHGWIPSHPPADVAAAIVQMGEYTHLPKVTGFARLPILRPDGSILIEPGHDPATGVFFDPGEQKFLAVKDHPTAKDVKHAVSLLLEPMEEFPFVSEVDRAVAVSMLLEAVMRVSLPAAPLYLCDANAPGTGKTLLAQAVCTLITGGSVFPLAYITESTEQRKSLFSALLGGSPVHLLDNIDEPMKSRWLCQMTTGEGIYDRVLGLSKSITASSSVTLIATGNNLTVRGDLCRRTLRCTQDAGMEHPENRKDFKRNLSTWVPAHRAELAWAALTLVRGYLAAGSPSTGIESWGSFDVWTDRIRAPMVWAGLPDPYGSNKSIKEEDEDSDMLGAILHGWRLVFGSEPITVKKASEQISSNFQDESDAMLRDVLSEHFPSKSQGRVFDSAALGLYFRRNKDQIKSGFRLRNKGKESHTRKPLWRVERV